MPIPDIIITKDFVITSQNLISSVIGLISGGVGSLIAPWIHWGIEKKREQLSYRKQKIADWRRLLNQEDNNSLREQIFNSDLYNYLSKEDRESLCGNCITLNSIGSATYVGNRQILQNAIIKLEIKWGLI